jgi:hypothetical protein
MSRIRSTARWLTLAALGLAAAQGASTAAAVTGGGESRDGGRGTMGEFTLTADHLRLLRQLRVAWASVEAGGPMIDGEMAFGSTEVERDVARILGHPGTRSEPDLGLPEGMLRAVAVLLDNGKLQPGTYEIFNGMGARMAGGGKLEIGDSVALEIPAAPTLRFEVTPEHLKLFAHAGFNEVGFDVKRPYGNRTYYRADIAEALGVAVARAADGSLADFKPEQIARFDKLHGEMLFTFQAFLQYAQLEPGVFVMRDGRWTRKDKIQAGDKPASR